MTGTISVATPYDALIGQELVDGWVVASRATSSANSTGGNFSVGYIVSRADGREGFCKVIDMRTVLTSGAPMATMKTLASDFEHEVASLEMCTGAKVKRVVLALGSESTVDFDFPMGVLSYIIFERADGDIRMVLPLTRDDADLPLRFALLHDAALGIAELHKLDIAHQDIKPSNILAIPSEDGREHTGKVADLGRAIVSTRAHRFDSLHFPGDRSYAPPEYWYGFVPASDDERRRGTDLYQLGSLIAFVIAGSSMPALVHNLLDPALAPMNWSGPYADVEPFIRAATDVAIETTLEDVPSWAAQPLRELLEALCDSDFATRNAMVGGAAHVSRFSLQRVISSLDLLQKRAIIETRENA